MRAHFLHELANWDVPNFYQRCVVGEFVVQLMRRARAFRDDEMFSTLEDLDSTIFAKFRQAYDARNALVYICHAEAFAAQIERL